MNAKPKLPENWNQMLDALQITLRAMAQISARELSDTTQMNRFLNDLRDQIDAEPDARPMHYGVREWGNQFEAYVRDARAAIARRARGH